MTRSHHMESGVVGDTAVISGVGAAIVLRKLLPANPKAVLLGKGITGDGLDVALEAVDALHRAAAHWGEDTISRGGNGEGQIDSEAPELEPWISTSQAAKILSVSARRVRQFREEGSLERFRTTSTGALEFSILEVLTLSRQRTERVDG